MQSKGPSAQFLSKLVVEGPNRPDKVFQTNQKYIEYMAYLGQQKAPITAYTKLAQWKQYKFEDVNLLLDPAKISPLLSALSDENKTLKGECIKQANDIMELTITIERLIDDNITIKKHLDLKNNELQHFLETQKLQIRDEASDFQFQIQSLQDENNVLIRHLEEMRRNQNDEAILNLQTELNNARELFDQQQQNFQQCQEREYDLSRELIRLKPILQESQEKLVELSTTLGFYEDENHDLRNQILLLKNNVDLHSKQTQDQIISKQMELETFQQQFNTLIIEKEKLIDKLNSYELKISELEKETFKQRQELQQYQMMNDELLNQSRDIKNQLDLERMRKVPVQSNDDINKQQLIVECKRLHEQLERAQHEYIKLDDFMTKQLEIQKKQSEQIVENMKIRYTSSLDSRQEQITFLERQVTNQLESIEILKKELDIERQQLQEVKLKQEDSSQLKKLIDSQVMELRILKAQISDKKMLINEMIDEKDKLSKLMKSEQLANQQVVYQLEQEIKQLQNQQIKYQSQQEDIQKLLEMNEKLKQDVSQLQQAYKEVQMLCRDETEKRQQLQVEAGIQANQIGVLREQIKYYQDQQQRKDKLDQVLQENQILRAQLKQ